jgi:hypothetical protein
LNLSARSNKKTASCANAGDGLFNAKLFWVRQSAAGIAPTARIAGVARRAGVARIASATGSQDDGLLTGRNGGGKQGSASSHGNNRHRYDGFFQHCFTLSSVFK